MGEQIDVVASFSGGGELDRLAQLDELAAELRRTARPANTRRTYAAAWNLWREYCGQMGISPTANTEGALIGFVGWYSQRRVRPDTIRNRLAGIYVHLREDDAEPTTLVKQHVAEAVARLETEQVQRGELAPPRRAPILADGHLEAMMAAQPDTLRGLRDTAVLAMWFGLARRRSELATRLDARQMPIGLMVPDIQVTERGMTVAIRVIKGGRAGTVAVPRQDSPLCPVAAWTRWQQAAAITTGPAFRRLTSRSDTLTPHGIGEKTIRQIIADAERRAGLNVGYTGHSGRRTFVTRAVDAGASLGEITRVTLHAEGSATVHKYYDVRDEWTQNPLNKIV
jgi:site-specific recombinase XerD